MSLGLADQILKEVSQRTIAEYKAVCADIHKAIHKIDNTIDNSVSMVIAQLATDFIASHDLTDIQSITMRNFIDWVALQHT